MEGLLAATPVSPHEGCNVPSATCTSRECTGRASPQGDEHQCVPTGVSSGNECRTGGWNYKCKIDFLANCLIKRYLSVLRNYGALDSNILVVLFYRVIF